MMTNLSELVIQETSFFSLFLSPPTSLSFSSSFLFQTGLSVTERDYCTNNYRYRI